MSHDDLMLALALADRADELTRVRFGALDLRIDTKPDLTPVTDADRAVESDVRQTLGRDRPGDGVLGEGVRRINDLHRTAVDRRPDRRHQKLCARGAGVGQFDRAA